MLTKLWKELNHSTEVSERMTLTEYEDKRGFNTVYLYTLYNGKKYIVDCTNGECTRISQIRPKVK